MSDPYYGSRPQNSTMAVISLVAGILGLTFMPGLASIIAIITASMAEKEINASGGSLEGANLARIGKILGWIGVALGVLLICCMLVFFLVIPSMAVIQSSGLLPILLPFTI